ncbi:MAG: ATP-binding protein [Lachnospiraceae bacterium]|nr:ATP-binding protein [Lachnospiraceae bacterium]
MPLKYTPDKIIQNRNYAVTDSAPKANQKKEIQWNVSTPRYTMNDLILDTPTFNQLFDVISYFKNRELLFGQWGLSERFASQDGLAVNLYGHSGTGKTMAAHAITNELQKMMICVDYAEIESKYVGETSKNLSKLFQTATEQDLVIFFDEADALLSKRVTNMTSSTDVSVNQTRSVLLNLMNQYQGVIIFATNFIQNFDVAFLRRIKYHIQFHLPGIGLREQLWKTYIPEKMPCQVDYADLARKFSGISGSDIANAVFSAAVGAARDKEQIVLQNRFEEAIQHCIEVKLANQGGPITVSKRIVNEEEMKKI